MFEVQEVPEHRCGFELTHEHPRVDWAMAPSQLRDEINAVSCCREPWRDSERCIWHAEVEDKPLKELKNARRDGPERVDGAYLVRLKHGDKLPLPECVLLFADFTDADLKGADFTDADLTGTDFTDADLEHAVFTDADLEYAAFTDTNVKNTDFTDADLEYAVFADANLLGADFTDTDLTGADFTNAYVGPTNVLRPGLPGADFTDAHLPGAVFTDAYLENTTFTDTNLKNSDFTDAYLRGTDLSQADLKYAVFTDADLRTADFTRADLRDSYLTHATLHDMILTQADCRGTTFTSALLYEVVFADTRINSRTTFYDSGVTHYESITSRPACVYEENPLTSEDLPDDTHPLEAAEWVYRRLEKLHDENALSEEASEFHISKEEARREHQKERLTETREQLSDDLADNNANEVYESFVEMLRWDTRYSVSTLNWHLTRHGESIRQIFVSAGVFILACGLLYPFVGGFESSANDAAYRIPLTEAYQVFSLDGVATLLQSIYFSIITFTTIGYGDLYPTGTGSKVLVGFESLAGAILIALFVFVLGRQVAR